MGKFLKVLVKKSRAIQACLGPSDLMFIAVILALLISVMGFSLRKTWLISGYESHINTWNMAWR